jgi:hypothetical protein
MRGMTDTLAGVPELSARRFDDLQPGEAFGPFTEPLPAPDRLALPDRLPLLTLRVLRRALHGIIPGGVLTQQRFAIHRALPAEGEVGVLVRVGEQRRARAGLFTSFTFELRDQEALCAVVEWTILDPEQA